MPGFVYYLPGRSIDEVAPRGHFDREVLAEVGLADTLRDVDKHPAHATLAELSDRAHAGPGVLFYPHPKNQAHDYAVRYHDGLEWHHASDALEIGWEADAPPEPEDLARPRQIRGWQIRDDYDRQWLVPVARSVAAPAGLLPVEYTFNDAGEVEGGNVKPLLRPLWQLAGEVWDFFNWKAWSESNYQADEDPRPSDLPADPEDPDFEPPGRKHSAAWLATVALAALATNYRLGPHEANALAAAGRGVIDQTLSYGASWALINGEFLEEFQAAAKKNDGPARRSTSSSPAADTAATTPGAGPSSPPPSSSTNPTTNRP